MDPQQQPPSFSQDLQQQQNQHQVTTVDPDVEAMKKRVREMEAEAARLREMHASVEREVQAANRVMTVSEEGASNTTGSTQVDTRSIYVGNVDYGATPEELQAHFASCGSINRITIVCDKWTGAPKGFAYIEFSSDEAVQLAMALDGSTFRGRQIKVVSKRTNIPGYNASMMRGRGRGGYYGRGGMTRGGWRGRGGRGGHFVPY